MFPILEEGQYGSMYALRPSIQRYCGRKLRPFPKHNIAFDHIFDLKSARHRVKLSKNQSSVT